MQGSSFNVTIPESLRCSLVKAYQELLCLHGQVADIMYGIQREQYPKLQDLVSQSGIAELPWQWLYEECYLPCLREAMQYINGNPSFVHGIDEEIKVPAPSLCNIHFVL